MSTEQKPENTTRKRVDVYESGSVGADPMTGCPAIVPLLAKSSIDDALLDAWT